MWDFNEPPNPGYAFWGCVKHKSAPFLAPRHGTWRQKQKDVAQNLAKVAPDLATQIGAFMC